jgi:type IV pilus secretin PilQ/predicted competence protein
MVDPKNGWLLMGIQGVVATCVAIFALGCASPPPSGDDEGQAMVQTLGEVTVSRDGEDSVIHLSDLIDPIYSVTTEDERNVVVIDLVGVGKPAATSPVGAVSDEARQVAAYDGVVDLVTMSTFDEDAEMPLTRVEVVMAGPGRAEVVSTGDGLDVRIIPESELAAVSPEDAAAMDEMAEGGSSDPWAAEGGETDSITTRQAFEPVAEVVALEPPPAATMLTGIEVKEFGDGVLVGLEADGAIGGLEAFTLADPARLVIDLPGVSAGEGAPSRISVDSKQVQGVRMAAHADKVRVVIDGGSEANDFQGRQIMPGTTGLWVSVGEGEALQQAMNDALSAAESAWRASAQPVVETTGGAQPAAALGEAQPSDAELIEMASESPMESMDSMDRVGSMDGEAAIEIAAPASDAPMVVENTDGIVETEKTSVLPAMAGDLIQVYGLHYERADGVDRIAILGEDPLTYSTSAPDPTTLVVRIPGASISEEASDRIFPKAGGPISMIHAFQQPEVEVPEVRVVFTRAPDQEPVVSRRGSMLFVEFQDLGVAAAPPPGFPHAGDSEATVLASAISDPAKMSTESPSADAKPSSMQLLKVDGPGATMAASMAAGDSAASPGFELGDTDAAAMGAGDPLWDGSAAATPGMPAAVEMPAAIEVLEEGGLIDGKEYRGRRVSLDFKDVGIADVLRLIAEVSDLNIIAGDEVDGNVTIRLVEVPWDQALDVILMTKGLGFVRVGNVLRIAPADVLKAEEEVRLQERRNKEKLEDLEVKLLPVNYASVKEVSGLVKRLLSARGTVNLDTRTNTLIIKDIPSVIDEATALIAAVDTQTPQVMIESKIVEAALGFSRELGAVWSIQTNQFENAFDPDTLREDLGSEDLTFIGDNGLAFANPITSVPTAVASFGALILDQDFRVDAQIQAAESQGDGKVISSPRIVTLDNKEARIEQGVSIPFQTFEGGDAKLEFIDAVLSLVVTPHITADESIIMEIEVTRNAPDDSVATPTGSPAIAKNVAETETLVKDGQTLVLGGIYTIEKSKRQSRVPYLHRIPVIGNAFKSNEVTDARKELLIFVTPRVVRLPEMASK